MYANSWLKKSDNTVTSVETHNYASLQLYLRRCNLYMSCKIGGVAPAGLRLLVPSAASSASTWLRSIIYGTGLSLSSAPHCMFMYAAGGAGGPGGAGTGI